MDLVLDANVLLSALIKEGFTRAIILGGAVNLYAPEFLLDELTKHMGIIVKKSGMRRCELESYPNGFLKLLKYGSLPRPNWTSSCRRHSL